jgi:hypothetical protein
MVSILLPLLILAGSEPEFARHPAEPALVDAPAAPSLASAKARRFRTRLRDAAAEGANFNGHYALTHWGCGTNCIEWAVVDPTDGAVWFAPEPAFSCEAPEVAQDRAAAEVTCRRRGA